MIAMPNGLTTKVPYRALVVSSQLRAPEFPDIPTFFELGYDISFGGYQTGISIRVTSKVLRFTYFFLSGMALCLNRYISRNWNVIKFVIRSHHFYYQFV
jgi:hypothetical protein